MESSSDTGSDRGSRRDDLMRAQPLPVVLITSHYDAATIERAKQAGVMGYLVKPLRAEETG